MKTNAFSQTLLLLLLVHMTTPSFSNAGPISNHSASVTQSEIRTTSEQVVPVRTTLIDLLANWADEAPQAVAQTYKVNGIRQNITAKEYAERVYWLALYLQSMGIGKDDVGVILAYNSPQWVHSELATILAGGKSAGVYPNSNQKDIQYILDHTQARLISVQNREYFDKIPQDSEALQRAAVILVFDGDVSFSSKAVGYDAAVQEGKRLATQEGAHSFREMIQGLDPDDGAFIIYTSGTTGAPKGVMTSHDNIIFTMEQLKDRVHFGDFLSTISFLPLCHIAEKLQNVGGGLVLRATVNFVPSFDSVSKELVEVQPTLLLSVPRLWEKMMEGADRKVDQSKGLRKKLAKWALKTGAKHADAKLHDRKIGTFQKLKFKFADKLVLSKARHAMGLSRCEVPASGAAALPAHVARWFRSVGLFLVEDYGQSESTGVICLTDPDRDQAGTVGRPVAGIEFKIAEDGEILTQGRHVFKGYYKNEAATASTLVDGWLLTGDLGELDSEGLVRIKGRKKELMKTSGGKYVAPLPIEEEIKVSPLISQVCLVGDGRKFISALITLNEEKLNELKTLHPEFMEGAVIQDSAVIAEVQKLVNQTNSGLSSYEQIKKFAVLSKEFSIDSNEMTPTLKMKRNIIEANYKGIIDGFYQ